MLRRAFVALMALALAAWGLGPSVMAGEEPLTLALRPEGGSVYIQRESFEYNMTLGTGGEGSGQAAAGSMVFKMGLLTKVEVREAGDGGRESVLGLTFLALMQDTSMPGGFRLALDTTDPFTPPWGSASELAAIIGDGYVETVDSRGKVVAIEGWRDLGERVAARLGLPEEEKEAHRERWNDGIIPAGMEGDSFPSNYAAGLYPEEPVRIGDSWSSMDTSYQGGLLLTLDNRYHLRSRRNGVATIEARSIVRSQALDARTAADGYEPEMTVTGRQTAVIEMDEATGWILRIELEQLMRGEMTMLDPGSGDMNSVSIVWQGRYGLISNRRS